MRALVLLAVALTGCHTPCERTARHAMAMARSCVDTKDAKLALVCGASYEAVRHELTTGDACKAEVTR